LDLEKFQKQYDEEKKKLQKLRFKQFEEEEEAEAEKLLPSSSSTISPYFASPCLPPSPTLPGGGRIRRGGTAKRKVKEEFRDEEEENFAHTSHLPPSFLSSFALLPQQLQLQLQEHQQQLPSRQQLLQQRRPRDVFEEGEVHRQLRPRQRRRQDKFPDDEEGEEEEEEEEDDDELDGEFYRHPPAKRQLSSTLKAKPTSASVFDALLLESEHLAGLSVKTPSSPKGKARGSQGAGRGEGNQVGTSNVRGGRSGGSPRQGVRSRGRGGRGGGGGGGDFQDSQGQQPQPKVQFLFNFDSFNEGEYADLREDDLDENESGDIIPLCRKKRMKKTA
jgi:hypothetical protein